jgi:hypothetical protein
MKKTVTLPPGLVSWQGGHCNGGAGMATAEALMAIVGSPVASDAVRAIVATDGLTASADADMDEGVPPREYLSSQAAGYELVHEGGRVVTAFLYVEPTDGYAPFPGPLPGNLSRGATRADARASFGVPERSGGATTVGDLTLGGAWDRFAVGDLRIHFQFGEPGERVELVTVMAADSAP